MAPKSPFDDPNFVKMYAMAEKVTGQFGKKLLVKAGFESFNGSEKLTILDSCCGTGVIAVMIMEMLSEKSKDNLELTCADSAPAMLTVIEKRIKTNDWKGVRTLAVDAQDSGLPESHFTHVTCNFGPTLCPQPHKALGDMCRVLAAGGTLAWTTWRTNAWLADVKAAFETNPRLPQLPTFKEMMNIITHHSGDWDDPKYDAETMEQLGLVEVDAETVSGKNEISVEEFLLMMPGTVGMLQNYLWSEEQKKTLSEEAYDSTRKYMVKTYGDRAIEWEWSCNLVVAKKPR